MNEFDDKVSCLFEQFGDAKKMVLSTALDNKVTSRMMSIIIMNQMFYFQTDVTFRKYEQIKNNPNVSLCTENIQIEGICKEQGMPLENFEFSAFYDKYFSGSYKRYSALKNERLFNIQPSYIQVWIYEGGEPFIESFDFERRIYEKRLYIGE